MVPKLSLKRLCSESNHRVVIAAHSPGPLQGEPQTPTPRRQWGSPSHVALVPDRLSCTRYSSLTRPPRDLHSRTGRGDLEHVCLSGSLMLWLRRGALRSLPSRLPTPTAVRSAPLHRHAAPLRAAQPPATPLRSAPPPHPPRHPARRFHHHANNVDAVPPCTLSRWTRLRGSHLHTPAPPTSMQCFSHGGASSYSTNPRLSHL